MKTKVDPIPVYVFVVCSCLLMTKLLVIDLVTNRLAIIGILAFLAVCRSESTYQLIS